jgi:hopanoid biosynthesis associated RND transporter like protein HpnN
LVVLLGLLRAAASIGASARWLGVSTDTGKLFSTSLDWWQRSADIAKLFPQNDKLIVAVIDAAVPEVADATAAALADALAGDRAHFSSIRRPDANPYLRRNAFLLIPAPDLQTVLDRTVDAQPFLGTLAADPSLGGLFSALGLVVQGVQHGQSVAGVGSALGSFHTALAAAAAGHAVPLSWQRLLGGKLADMAGKYRFVLMKPVLNYGALQPGGAAGDAARQAAQALPAVRSGLARVRFTGQVVLDDEEFATVAQGAVAGLLGSFAFVALWLFLALRSWRLILPVLATLILGLLLTTGFAAAAIGTLNLVSVAFAVLFVGIAVDFAIQFAVRFREQLLTAGNVNLALASTGRRVGGQIMVAALATAAGFLAFVPTQFVGVAQLGEIAGVGMVIAFACTLTFLPALLSLCRAAGVADAAGLPAGAAIDAFLRRHRRVVVATFAALACGGAALVARIPFDGDPLHTKDQTTESVRTLGDLAENPFTNPFNIQAIMPSEAAAQAAGTAYAALPHTEVVLTLQSFVPAGQAEKLAIIKDAAGLLLPTLTPATPPPPVTAGRLRQAAALLAASLDGLQTRLPAGDALRAIGGDARRLSQAPDDVLMNANHALTEFLPAQLNTLRDALAARPVTLADMPDDLRRDWLLPDGRARVQALPRSKNDTNAVRAAWVEAAVRAVPQSSGSAVYVLRSTEIVVGAFRLAALGALGAIAVILALVLRRLADVLLVMAPLLASALITALMMLALGLTLNFANVIALPLLLGVGVSFNIYFVMNWRAGGSAFLATPTARAVVFSALTTSTAFGSLALSRHPGTASMGVLLLLSLACTVLTTLLFEPALLSLVGKQGQGAPPPGPPPGRARTLN